MARHPTQLLVPDSLSRLLHNVPFTGCLGLWFYGAAHRTPVPFRNTQSHRKISLPISIYSRSIKSVKTPLDDSHTLRILFELEHLFFTAFFYPGEAIKYFLDTWVKDKRFKADHK